MLLCTLDFQELPGGYNLSTGGSNRFTRAYVTEVILTFLLCFTVFGTIDPNRDMLDGKRKELKLRAKHGLGASTKARKSLPMR